MGTCDRCGVETRTTIMSRFNTETICLNCEEREREHPKYALAKEAELAAVQAGNYNYPGIGCPPELYERRRPNE